jgi:hypothetical protein
MGAQTDVLTVACVLRSGGCYTVEYVERLRDAVERHLSLPYEFVCLTDLGSRVPCARVDLEYDWPGWWSKLELFEAFTGPTLYFDLDTTIQGSIDDLAAYPHRFTMLRDFMRPDALASGVMAWSGDWSALTRAFDPREAGRYQGKPYHGDGGFIDDKIGARGVDTFQALFPGAVTSRKCDDRGAIRRASVVCWHGKPRPHERGWKL